MKVKTIRTIYLYTVSLISLLFLAIGTGGLINTLLKAYVFPEAEKRDYYECNQPYYQSVDLKELQGSDLTSEQEVKVDNIISEYEKWKTDNTGEKCYASARQKAIVDKITMIVISFALYVFHWRLAKKEKEE